MAPVNGTQTIDRNGLKPRIKPVVPALPLMRKPKKPHLPPQSLESGIQEPFQTTHHTSEKQVDNEDDPSQKSFSKADESLGSHYEVSTPSVSALDESGSVQSSQDPSPAVEHDSATSAITSELNEPPLLDSQVSVTESNDAAKHFQIYGTPDETEKLMTTDLVSITTTEKPQENGLLESARVTPETVPLVTDVSPMTHLSSDKVPVETSVYATPMSTAITHPEVSPEAVKPFHYRQSHNRQNHSYPEVAKNVRQPVAHRAAVSNGYYDTPPMPKPLPTILEHLIFLVNSKQLADWTIQIDQPGLNIAPFVTYGHAAVLLRSDRIRTLMAHPHEGPYNIPVIHLTPARTIQPHAFEAALRFLYSDTVLSAEALLPRDTYLDRHARIHIVDYVLSYWIAGVELDVEPVSSCAYSLLAGIADWDVAEFLVKDALAIRSFAASRTDVQPLPGAIAMGESILRLVLGLFLHRFDATHFKLDGNCQPSTMPSRFAQVDQARASANPVLAGMVFGSMPTSINHSPALSADESTRTADSIASAILLNLDFSDLSQLSKDFIRTHGSAGAHIISEVINEREKKRRQILENNLVSNKDRIANSTVWDVVGWQEIFDQGELHRERVGYVLPSKKNKNAQLEI